MQEIDGLIPLFLFILRKSKEERANSKIDRTVDDRVSVTAYKRPNIYARSTAPWLMRLTVLGLPPYSIFTIEEIEDATNNFPPSNLIGEGSHGQLGKVGSKMVQWSWLIL